MNEQVENKILVPEWELPKGVKAFYSSRHGGESLAPFDSFNIATHVDDDPMDVDFNRQQLPLHDRIAWLNQIHSTRCVEANSQYFLSLEAAKADAIYSRLPNVVCAVMTADCLPILIANKYSDCIAAVHAGWRGLAGGILQNVIKMLGCDPKDLTIWVGPHISQKNYKVGQELVSAFSAFSHAFDVDTKGDYFCNLFAIAESIAQSLGVKEVFNSDICTFDNHKDFYSHRHASNLNQPITGRFVSGIYIEP